VLAAIVIVSTIQGRMPYVTIGLIGLPALGTILWRSVVRLPYPQFGGLLGGCIATVFEFMLDPVPFQIVNAIVIENLAIAFVVSLVVVSVLDVFSRNDVKAS
ncbi:MAG: hypothetical protein ACKVT0_01925, partial [Planctomycetaceae bacterium]